MSISARESRALQQLQEARDRDQWQACMAKRPFQKWEQHDKKASSPNKARAGATECQFQPTSPGHSSSARRQVPNKSCPAIPGLHPKSFIHTVSLKTSRLENEDFKPAGRFESPILTYFQLDGRFLLLKPTVSGIYHDMDKGIV